MRGVREVFFTLTQHLFNLTFIWPNLRLCTPAIIKHPLETGYLSYVAGGAVRGGVVFSAVSSRFHQSEHPNHESNASEKPPVNAD